MQLRSVLLAAALASVLPLGCKHAPAPSAGRLYVSGEQSGTVAVVDLGTNAVVATIPVGKRPRGVQVSPDGKRVYVALSGSIATGPGVAKRDDVVEDRSADGIGVIDTAKNEKVAVLVSGSDPEQFAVSADGKRLYIANEDAAGLSVVDTEKNALLGTVSIGTEPEGVSLMPDAKTALVASETGNVVDVVDVTTNALVGTIPVGGRPRAIAIAKSGTRAIVTLEDAGSIALIDPVNRKLVRTAKLPGDGVRPMGVALSPDDRVAYVTTGRGKKLFAIDTNTCVDQWVLEVGDRPWGVTVSPDGKRVYTANGPSNDVSVVDVETQRVVARIPTPGRPWGLAIRP